MLRNISADLTAVSKRRYIYREEMQVKISEAGNLIGMLEAATAAIKTENPEQIVQRICKKVNMPQMIQNLLFKMTIKSHMES